MLKNNKENNLNSIFSQLLDLEIDNIKINDIVELKSLSEYQFWMYKVTIKLKNGREFNAFFKYIENYKIKESIYCYWNIFIEQFNKDINNINDIKASILEEKKDKYKNTIYLESKSKKNDLNKYKTKIYLINISKYLKENTKRLIDKSKENNEKLLFIGLIS